MSDTEDKKRAKSVQDIFNEIESKASDGGYIFRGEPKEHPEMSSSLYRQYKKIDTGRFDIEVVQSEMLKEASRYTDIKDDLEILAVLQHYGGETNFIDFTQDYRIALFFACDGDSEKDGRVILKRKTDTKEYGLHEPDNPKNRIIAQKSIFIRPFKGWLDLPDEEIVCIPSELKKYLLEHLNEYHSISTVTIYNDLHGFIKKRELHPNAYIEFYKGFAAHEKALAEKDPSKKIEHFKDATDHYSKAIKLNPQNISAYNNRGSIKNNFEDYSGAVSDFDEAIRLDPRYAEAYTNRGIAKKHLGKRPEAIADFSRAIEINPQDAKAYYNLGFIKGIGGEYQEAIDNCDKAIEIDPRNSKFYLARGLAKFHMERYREAIIDFDKAIELNPQYAEAYYGRSLAKEALSDPSYKQDLEQVLALAEEQGSEELAQKIQRELDELKKK